MADLNKLLPLRPQLPLPPNVDEHTLRTFVQSVAVAGANPEAMFGYASSDFRRFVYTWGMTSGISGRALELGANPYFTTMLLKRYTDLELTLANYFNDTFPSSDDQRVDYVIDARPERTFFHFDHFNVERSTYPYADGTFDLVIFCEIIEHLIHSPMAALREIRRILKPGGRLILTTPNVARFENVAQMIAGANMYDPFSEHGLYGRHNREYNRHELDQMLRAAGLRPEIMFTADVNENVAGTMIDVKRVVPLVQFRKHDLGQYIFIRAVADVEPQTADFPFLHRGYVPD